MKIEMPDPKLVLAFNPARILVGVFRSVRAAGEISLIQPQAISNCCNGRTITCGGLYWRHLPKNIELDSTDIGTTNLEEFDNLCGIERKYLSSRKIINKRNIQPKNKKICKKLK